MAVQLFAKFSEIKFIRIRSAVHELFHAYGQTDGTIVTDVPRSCECTRIQTARMVLLRLLSVIMLRARLRMNK